MDRRFSLLRPLEALSAQLTEVAPRRLLHVGNSTLPLVEAYQAAFPQRQVSHCPAGPLPPDIAGQRFDLALFTDCLEHLSKPVAEALLGSVRNLNARRLCVLVDQEACGWCNTDFFALAFQLITRFQRNDQILCLYGYDIRHYKQPPEWLNARFWANPEHFGKYWW